jgi:hypothetical protein
VTKKKSPSPSASPQKSKKNKTRSPTRRLSPTRSSNTAPYFEEQERWKNGKYKFFCGIHAFNNLIGRPDAITKEHIFETCTNERVRCDKRIGNFYNETLVEAINTLPNHPYSAMMDLMYLSMIDENNNAKNILRENMNNTKKGLAKNIYTILLRMKDAMDSFVGFIMQINYGENGHYIAVKYLDDGKLKIIDSMKTYDTYAPLDFYDENPRKFRENCAAIINKFFEIAEDSDYLQFIIVLRD